jgi:hypothetical protein
MTAAVVRKEIWSKVLNSSQTSINF